MSAAPHAAVMADAWLSGAVARLELLRAALAPAGTMLPQDGLLEVLGDTLADLARLRAIVAPEDPPEPEAGA